MSRPWAAFWLLGIVASSSFIFNKIATRELTAFEIVFIRFTLASIGLLFIMWLRGARLPTDRASLRYLVIIGVGNQALPFTIFTWGQARIDSGLASILVATIPLFTLLAAHFTFDDERMNLPKVIGVSIGFAGIIILATRGLGADGGGSDLLGQVAVLGDAVISAIFGVYTRKLMRDLPDPLAVAAGANLVTGAALALPALVFPVAIQQQTPGFLAGVSGDVLAAVFVLGLVNTILITLLFYYLLPTLGAGRTSTVAYVIPPFTLVWATLFLGEVIDLRLLFGAAVIFSGLALVNLQRSHLRRGLRMVGR